MSVNLVSNVLKGLCDSLSRCESQLWFIEQRHDVILHKDIPFPELDLPSSREGTSLSYFPSWNICHGLDDKVPCSAH